MFPFNPSFPLLLLLVAVPLALGNINRPSAARAAVPSPSTSYAGVFSHAQCTVPAVDEPAATHYRGTWGPSQFHTARTLQRVCLCVNAPRISVVFCCYSNNPVIRYSNVCFRNEKSSDEDFMEAEFFSPVTPNANPPHHLGFEPFTIGGREFRFYAFHGNVPADYAWALDAGATVVCKRPADCMTARNRCALFE